MKNRKDRYYNKARAVGYRSRAAYKLLEIDNKFTILERAYNILELGSSPGGWTDVLLDREPEYILSVDMIIEKSDEYPFAIRGDIRRQDAWERIADFLQGRKMDLILSDAMSHTSGQHDRDHAASVEICTSIVDYGTDVLRVGGNMLMKQFQGQYTEEFFRDHKPRFRRSYITKPKASRDSSSEVYIIFAGYLGSD